MTFFLQGPPRIGKSTVLRDALLPHTAHVAGLMVQRLFEDGQKCGYRACVVRGELPPVDAPHTEGMDGVFLYHGRAQTDVLAQAITEARAACAHSACRLAVLDEIGGIELLDNAFMQPLRGILALGKPCAGVIKARSSLEGLAARQKLPADILPLWDGLHQSLAAEGRVLAVTPETLPEAQQAAANFVAAVFGGQH